MTRASLPASRARCFFDSARVCGISLWIAEPPGKGRVVEDDVRNASKRLRSYRGKVKLVITSPPYLDITDYHEDQWLRLWFLGGAAKPITGRSRDDRHRRVESYWEFLREAWKASPPSFMIRLKSWSASEERAWGRKNCA